MRPRGGGERAWSSRLSDRRSRCRSRRCSRCATCGARAGRLRHLPLGGRGRRAGARRGGADPVARRALRVPGGAARRAAGAHAADRGRAAARRSTPRRPRRRARRCAGCRAWRRCSSRCAAAAGCWPRARCSAVELVGFEGEVPASFPGAAGGPPGLYVSEPARRALGPRPRADVLEVVSPRPTLTPLGPQPRIRSRAAGRHLRERPHPGGAGARRAAARRWPRRCSAPRDRRLEVDGRRTRRARSRWRRGCAAVAAAGERGAHLAGPQPAALLRPAPGEGGDVRGRVADRAGGGAGADRRPGADHRQQAAEIGMLGDDGRHAGRAAPRLPAARRPARRLGRWSAAPCSASAAPGCSTATSCCRCPGGSTSSTTCRSWCSRRTCRWCCCSPWRWRWPRSFYAAQRAAALDPVEAMRR